MKVESKRPDTSNTAPVAQSPPSSEVISAPFPSSASLDPSEKVEDVKAAEEKQDDQLAERAACQKLEEKKEIVDALGGTNSHPSRR